jgi:Uma2 family endonuclease
MGESQPHIEAIRALLDALDDLFWDDDRVSVHGNVHWYWKKGDATLTRAPDAMVIPGVPMDHDRKSYKSWEHGGRVPSVIIETASAKTYRANLNEVKDDYEANGVREYFIFDPSRLYLKKPLYGFRLARGRYRGIRADADGSIVSKELGVRLWPEGRILRLVDLQTGEPLKTRPERIAFYQERLAAEQARATEQETKLAEQAAELERVEAELSRARALLRKAGIDPDTVK